MGRVERIRGLLKYLLISRTKNGDKAPMFMPHAVARLENGMLDLASLVPNQGGFDPDPVGRIRSSRVYLEVAKLPPIDPTSVFKKLPMQVVETVLSGGFPSYGEF
jgi:hypothetical protein